MPPSNWKRPRCRDLAGVLSARVFDATVPYITAAAQIAAGVVAAANIANNAVSAKIFVGAPALGTAAPQIAPHGLGYIPSGFCVIPTLGNDGAGNPGNTSATNITAVSADATDITWTATAGGSCVPVAFG